MAGDLNAKHVDCNSRLITNRGNPYVICRRKPCLIFGPDTPTTIPYNPSANSDVLDIVVTKDLPIPVYLSSCSALRSDHLTVLIDTTCRSSFHQTSDCPNLRRTDWANFRNLLEDKIPFDPELLNWIAIDTWVENFSGPVLQALAASTP